MLCKSAALFPDVMSLVYQQMGAGIGRGAAPSPTPPGTAGLNDSSPLEAALVLLSDLLPGLLIAEE